jgi:hypothetical protein
MAKEKVSEIHTHIDKQYRFTFYPLFDGATGIVEIEVWQTQKFYAVGKWKRVYMGHIEPINIALQFYDRNLTKPVEKKEEK